MKTLIETKRKKMIFAIVLILIVGLIIVKICTNNATMASDDGLCEHDYKTQYNVDYHWQECTKCKNIKEKLPHSNREQKYDENYHWWECKDCDYSFYIEEREKHEYTTGGCTKCPKGNETGCTTSECTFEYKSDGLYHWKECTKCGKMKEREAHKYEQKYDDTNHWIECSVCKSILVNKQAHTLKNDKCEGCQKGWTSCTGECQYNEKGTIDSGDIGCEGQYCWRICTKCNKIESINTHKFNAGTCVVCGISDIKDEVCNHKNELEMSTFTIIQRSEAYDWLVCNQCFEISQYGKLAHNYVMKNGETHHWEECSKCKQVKQYSSTAHNFVNGVCECGAKEVVGNETCEHTYVVKYDETRHWEECSKCTKVKPESVVAHKYENEVCKICGAKEHNYVMKNDETHHWEECSKCGKTKTKEEHSYNVQNYDATNHWMECSRCNKVKAGSIQEHSYKDGICSLCNANEIQEKCDHTYTVKHDENNHWEECSKCNKVKAGSISEHTYIDGVCTCGAKETVVGEICEHTYVVKHDETNHWEECSKCDKVRAGSISEHTYKDGVCTCGAKETVVGEICEHTYVVKHDETNHWEECSKCNKVKAGSIQEHSYKDGVCTCGAKETVVGETCEHTYVVKHDETNHWEECSKCNKVKAGSIQEHSYKDGVCECGAKKVAEETPCEHTYIVKYDETKHWEECSKCKEVKKGSEEGHKYGEYKDNKDGTHSATCTVCKHKITEKHDTDKDCPKCEYTKSPENEDKDDNKGNNNTNQDDNSNGNNNNNNSSNNNNNNNNNSNKGDSTTVDKDIPHTGKSTVIVIAIIAVGAIGAISVVKMRKYKGV